MGQPGCLEFLQAGGVGAHFGLTLKDGFPQSLVECPRHRLPALVFGRHPLFVLAPEVRYLLLVARPERPVVSLSLGLDGDDPLIC